MLLVTGITGHTGRYFLQELINNRYEGKIRCIVRETSNTIILDDSGLNIEKAVGDLNDKEFVRSAMDGVNIIMHIYNIHYSPLIVQAAIEEKVERAILIHTASIYSKFKYASQGYKEVEKKITEITSNAECPTKVTILRPSMIYGDLCDKNLSKFIKMIDKIRIMPIVNGGKNLIQPINARDLGKACYSVLMNPEKTSGKAYDIAGEKPIKMIEAFRIISSNLNKKTIYINVPIKYGIFLARVAKVITQGKIDYLERVQRMGEDRIYLYDEAKNDFQYKPMSFEDGIRIEVKQYLENKRNL